jgi:hypothetical protein
MVKTASITFTFIDCDPDSIESSLNVTVAINVSE